MIRINRKLKKQEGFTLVELLIVLFIIGVLMSIVVPNIRAAGEKAQERACLANQKLIHVQMENYYLENGHYPSNTDTSDFLTDLYNENYLDSIPTCPVGDGTYSYEDDTGKLIISCIYHNPPVDITINSE